MFDSLAFVGRYADLAGLADLHAVDPHVEADDQAALRPDWLGRRRWAVLGRGHLEREPALQDEADEADEAERARKANPSQNKQETMSRAAESWVPAANKSGTGQQQQATPPPLPQHLPRR
eukprot:SAG22_NODE_437_length_10501_cov_3.019804_6_plen_120_part_00